MSHWLQNQSRLSPFMMAALLSGAFISALLSARGDPNSILANFGFYWAPHLVLLLTLWALRSSQGLLAGAAVVTSIYLALVGVWTFTNRHDARWYWLGYLFSFPGAFVGALLARWLEWRRSTLIVTGFVVGVVCVGVGVALNQLGLCLTVLYCGG